MAGHPPGPWRVGEWINSDHEVNYIEVRGKEFQDESYAGTYKPLICKVIFGDHARNTYQQASARLIAAAPDLLESLVWLMQIVENEGLDTDGGPDQEHFDNARAAIKDAQ